MTTLAIRQKLTNYIADADDKIVKALYTILEREIAERQTVALTDEQFKILDKEHQLHLSGQGKSYTRQEANEIIRGQRDY